MRITALFVALIDEKIKLSTLQVAVSKGSNIVI
jgi:hypothetical protein